MKKYLISIATLPFFIFGCNNSTSTDSSGSADVIPVSSETSTDTTLQNEGETSTIQVVNDANSMSSPSSSPVVASGLNPEHGQPGHRCDISVGAPLSSAPATTPPAPMQITTPAMTTTPVMTPEPVITDPSNSQSTVTAPGMNPPHGEPGHDCAVAVGAPLKK